jgi:NADPH2:quinone reductase
MKAVRIHANGGTDVLVMEEVPLGEPGPGMARVKIQYAGVNFIDAYVRAGLNPGPLPRTLGEEAAGVVEAVGPEVSDVQVGDRVAYAMQSGGYAEYALVKAAFLVKIPDGVETKTAAALMLQGMTAHYLASSTYQLGPSDTALVHAAAGGTGRLLVQVARLRGARVIGTVSTEEKERLAREAGAGDVIRYTEKEFDAETHRLTGGRGVDVVYDSVGKATFERSLLSLRPRGMMVLFGQSSGPVPPLDPQILNRGGSLFLTRPSLGWYIADRTELLRRAGDLFAWMAAGRLAVSIDRIFPLAEAAGAHRYLENRQTRGKVLLEI